MAKADDGRTDGELVGAINGGDWGAFEVLYFRYRDWVYRLGWRFCGSGEDAQDVVQEVFVYLAGKFPGFELTAGMMTFLYPAVKHTAIAIRKKRMRMVGMDDMVTRGQADTVTRGAERDPAAEREELKEVLGGLSEEHREVLLMRFVDDMSLEEIAGALAVPVGTVKSRLHHAVRGVREDARIVRWLKSVQ